MRSLSPFRLVLAVGLFCTSAAFGAAPSYTVTDLGTLGGTSSIALAINENSQITGVSRTTNNTAYHTFLYTNNSMTDLGVLSGYSSSAGNGLNNLGSVAGELGDSNDTSLIAYIYTDSMHRLSALGGSKSSANGLNDNQVVTGYAYTDGDAAFHAYRYTGGVMTDLGTLGGTNSSGYAINNNGQITGSADNSSGNRHAFRENGAGLIDLGTLGGSISYGYGINSAGDITGTSDVTGNGTRHAYLYSGGVMTDLMPGQPLVYAIGFGINDSGDVVGAIGDSGAFLYHAGTVVNLNTLIAPASGWVLTDARDINNAGKIVGYGTIGGQQHGFLLTPGIIPEPGTATALACALTAFIARRSRR